MVLWYERYLFNKWSSPFSGHIPFFISMVSCFPLTLMFSDSDRAAILGVGHKFLIVSYVCLGLCFFRSDTLVSRYELVSWEPGVPCTEIAPMFPPPQLADNHTCYTQYNTMDSSQPPAGILSSYCNGTLSEDLRETHLQFPSTTRAMCLLNIQQSTPNTDNKYSYSLNYYNTTKHVDFSLSTTVSASTVLVCL